MKTEAERKSEYLTALESNISEARDLLVDLRHALNDKEKIAQDDFNWGHNGDMVHAIDLLKAALASTGYVK